MSITIGHAWFVETMVNVGPNSPTGALALELQANLPEFAYFLIAGAILFWLSTPFRTVWWAAAAGLIAMAIEATARQYAFSGVDLHIAGALLIDLVLPVFFSLAGALLMRRALQPRS